MHEICIPEPRLKDGSKVKTRDKGTKAQSGKDTMTQSGKKKNKHQ